MKQAKKLKVQPTRLKNSQQILLPQENSNINYGNASDASDDVDK